MTAEQWKHLEPCGGLAFALCYASQSKMIPQIHKKKNPEPDLYYVGQDGKQGNGQN